MNYNKYSQMVFDGALYIDRVKQVNDGVFEVYCLEECFEENPASFRVCNYDVDNVQIQSVEEVAKFLINDIKLELHRLFAVAFVLADINGTSVEIEANKIIDAF